MPIGVDIVDKFLPTWKKLINKMKTNKQVHLGEIDFLESFPNPNVKTFYLKFYKLNPKYKNKQLIKKQTLLNY